MSMILHLQQVPARNGNLWIRHGWRVFRRQPLALLGLFAFGFLAGGLLSMLPVVGPVLGMASVPVFSLGFMLATHQTLQGGHPNVQVFLEPFKLTPARRNTQLQLCFSFALLAVLVLLGAERIDGEQQRLALELMTQPKPDPEALAQALTDPRLIWGALVRFGGLGLLAVPWWQAPALVHWGGQGAMHALFSSTLALWRNKAAFALNAISWMLLTMALSSVFSLALGLLGLGPLAMYALVPLGMMGAVVFYAGLYFSFVDCFAFGAPKAPTPPPSDETSASA